MIEMVFVTKIYSVKPVLENWQSSYKRCRKYAIVLSRAVSVTHVWPTFKLR